MQERRWTNTFQLQVKMNEIKTLSNSPTEKHKKPQESKDKHRKSKAGYKYKVPAITIN